MRFHSLLTAATIVVSSFSLELQAQDDKISVMHAAALFIKDSLPAGPVLLALDGVPLSSSKGDGIATSLNATRGTTQGAVTCTVPDKNLNPPRTCSIKGKQVIVEVLYPYVLGNKAQVLVQYTSEFRPGRVVVSVWELELLRDTATGAWRVSKVLAREQS